MLTARQKAIQAISWMKGMTDANKIDYLTLLIEDDRHSIENRKENNNMATETAVEFEKDLKEWK